ncbi:MAG: HD domain-containing phosphohydrolase [Candidatus Omnitrophota bacterium]
MQRLFLRVKKNLDMPECLPAFKKYLKNPTIEILTAVPDKYKGLKETETAKRMKKVIVDSDRFRSELKKVHKRLEKSLKKKDMEFFEYSEKFFGMCYPLTANDRIFGIIILSGLKREISSGFQKVFKSFVDMVIAGSVKEDELDEINKTIRPRIIALSTVHTVHRLITSTVGLSDLLPRIARLSLQLIEANRCSIKLVDKKKKILLPQTTIDIRKAKTKLKKVQIGKYAPGRAVKKGAPILGNDYLATPMIDEDVVGVITLYDKINGENFTPYDQEIMKTLSEQAAIAIKNAQLFKEQTDLTLSSIQCIAQLLENRSHCAHRAEASFFKLISVIGPKFNMNESETKMLQYAAMLHDAGQISIPEKVLMKRGGLTGREYDIVKTHPLKGASILSKFKPLKPIVPIILYHHENFDGSGYPKGLKKNDIPLAARILAVISGFEAMIAKKTYRKALSINAAVKEVRKNSGKQFDPKVVEAFCEAVRRKDIRRLLEKELSKGCE